MGGTVDLNADLGESFGDWRMGDDAAMLDIVSSANVACGFHAGDPLIMAATVEAAKSRGVVVGAHPGYRDLWGFGRQELPHQKPEDLVWHCAYQIGALAAIAKAKGHPLRHVKAHGALATRAMVDRAVADAIARAITMVDPTLAWYVLPATALEVAGLAAGLTVVREVFADRGYQASGALAPRGEPGALIHDPAEAADRVLAMVEEGAVTAITGEKVPLAIDTICVHGDSPGAVALARAVRESLEGAGWRISADALPRPVSPKTAF